MKTIDSKIISNHINKCYLEYDPSWPSNASEARIHSFKYHLEHTAGIKVDFVPAKDRSGRVGYEIQQVEIVEDPKFTMWLLRWA